MQLDGEQRSLRQPGHCGAMNGTDFILFPFAIMSCSLATPTCAQTCLLGAMRCMLLWLHESGCLGVCDAHASFVTAEHCSSSDAAPPGVALQPNPPPCVRALVGLRLSVRRCRVLRLHEGDRLEVCDGRGNLVTAELRGVTHKKRAYAEAVEGVRQARAPRSSNQRP